MPASIRQTVAGAPLVMGLTPYTLRGPLVLPTGSKVRDWPPYVDEERLKMYDDFVALVENRPWDVFASLKLKGDQKEKIVLALALPELVCNVWADSVWTDPPQLEFKSDEANARWEIFARENDLQQAGWESVFSAAMRGTSVWKLHVDEDEPIEQIRLSEVPASIFFPKLMRGSDRLFEHVVLAWEEDRAAYGDKKPNYWHVREVHQLGDDGRYTITTQERKNTVVSGGWSLVKDVEETDLDFIPIVDLHGARWSGRYWGLSELSRITGIVDEIDNRLSDIAEVLEYHGKPILQVPKSLMRGLTLELGNDRAFGISDPALADVAKYITWDGKIADQLASLDKLLELALLTVEAPITYFGLGVEGGMPSGTAMRLRLQNYLKKAARWQRREANRLRAIGEFVQRIEGKAQKVARDSKVNDGSPLPADEEQDARIENLLTGNAKLSSRKTSIGKLRRVEDVDEEVKAIEAEESAAGATRPAPVAPGLAAAGVAVAGEEAEPPQGSAPPEVIGTA